MILLIFIVMLVSLVHAGSHSLPVPEVQKQAAWATQQRSEAACVTPSAWGNCSSAEWSGDSCVYSITLPCAPVSCVAAFASIFVPPLAHDDPCVISSGYIASSNTCALQLDSRCEAKIYHERYAEAANGDYYGETVGASTSGATRRAVIGSSALWELMILGALAGLYIRASASYSR